MNPDMTPEAAFNALGRLPIADVLATLRTVYSEADAAALTKFIERGQQLDALDAINEAACTSDPRECTTAELIERVKSDQALIDQHDALQAEIERWCEAKRKGGE